MKAAAGDPHLSGKDFDNRIVDFDAIRRLRVRCDQAKRTLSSSTLATFEIDALIGGFDYSGTLSQCLRDSAVDKHNVHEAMMVGGPTRIHNVKTIIQSFFDGGWP